MFLDWGFKYFKIKSCLHLYYQLLQPDFPIKKIYILGEKKNEEGKKNQSGHSNLLVLINKDPIRRKVQRLHSGTVKSKKSKLGSKRGQDKKGKNNDLLINHSHSPNHYVSNRNQLISELLKK
jgi:hypothetical protein